LFSIILYTSLILCDRDIKTTNVLIDSDWRAKICDFSFGVQALPPGQGQGQEGGLRDEFVFGTTEFMAPEVALSEEFGVSAGVCVSE
jgi:serine/threonine protein kinase